MTIEEKLLKAILLTMAHRPPHSQKGSSRPFQRYATRCDESTLESSPLLTGWGAVGLQFLPRCSSLPTFILPSGLLPPNASATLLTSAEPYAE